MTRFVRKMSFYAVHVGREPGVYRDWAHALAQVGQFSGAKYKKFKALDEAELFVQFGDTINMELAKELVNTEFDDDIQNATNSQSQSLKVKNKTPSMRSKPYERPQKSNKLPAKETVSVCKGITVPETESGSKIVYTDGACENNGKRGARAGYGVYWGKNCPLNTCGRCDGIQTNQRAELRAISVAIKQAITQNWKHLTVLTDSQFSINCVTKWIHKWIKNNWIKNDGREVIHKEQVEDIWKDMQNIKVEFQHVRAHCGIEGNEAADKLAVEGAHLPPVNFYK